MTANDLLVFLRSVQEECGGAIPFERFMKEALYHPMFGYYSAHIADVGRQGDFATSATLGQGLGIAIAEWIQARSRSSGWRRIPVIEIGAGNGFLASAVLRHLGWLGRLRTDYTIVETSPILRKRQQELLRGLRVTWADSMREALRASGGHALIFSNELVDAFPCRLFERGERGWKELGLSIGGDGSLREVFLAQEPAGENWDAFRHLPQGQRIESHHAYRDWLDSWRKEWHSGALLTIDYGERAEHLHDRRPKGSLRAYWKHRRFLGRDIYARFGRQDLTADVNFSDLMAWGDALGWRTAAYTTQREFLWRWTRGKESDGDLFPLSGEGAGDAFKVLEQTPDSGGIPE